MSYVAMPVNVMTMDGKDRRAQDHCKWHLFFIASSRTQNCAYCDDLSRSYFISSLPTKRFI